MRWSSEWTEDNISSEGEVWDSGSVSTSVLNDRERVGPAEAEDEGEETENIDVDCGLL